MGFSLGIYSFVFWVWNAGFCDFYFGILGMGFGVWKFGFGI